MKALFFDKELSVKEILPGINAQSLSELKPECFF
jgi:hypothetical protein